MKALSIRQPWIWAMFHLGKDVENRTWSTGVRERVMLHASLKYDHEGAKWKLKHLYLWIKGNGPLPAGHMLTFLDGDKENCEPDNLMLISRAVNAYLNRNGYSDLAGGLKLTAIALAKVTQKASSLKKGSM